MIEWDDLDLEHHEFVWPPEISSIINRVIEVLKPWRRALS
jgi:hypothetical protein